MAAEKTNVLEDEAELKINSDPANVARVRQAVESLCCGGGFSEKAAAEVGLCVNEAVANVIRHAYCGAVDRPIEVRARLARDKGAVRGVRIEVRDWGCCVDPSKLPRKPHDPLKPGGLGLILMRKLMDEVVFEPQPDGMLLTMVRRKDR